MLSFLAELATLYTELSKPAFGWLFRPEGFFKVGRACFMSVFLFEITTLEETTDGLLIWPGSIVWYTLGVDSFLSKFSKRLCLMTGLSGKLTLLSKFSIDSNCPLSDSRCILRLWSWVSFVEILLCSFGCCESVFSILWINDGLT